MGARGFLRILAAQGKQCLCTSPLLESKAAISDEVSRLTIRALQQTKAPVISDGEKTRSRSRVKLQHVNALKPGLLHLQI